MLGGADRYPKEDRRSQDEASEDPRAQRQGFPLPPVKKDRREDEPAEEQGMRSRGKTEDETEEKTPTFFRLEDGAASMTAARAAS